MNNNILHDKEIAGLFEKDANGFAPDAAIRERLEYTFMLKSSSSEVKQNSFLGMFSWLLSWSHLPLKAAMVSVVLLFSLLNIPTVENDFLIPGQDSTYNAIPFLIDSSETSPFFADTCMTTKAFSQQEDNSNESSSYLKSLKFSSVISYSAKPHSIFSTLAPNASFLPRHLISRKSAPAGSNKLSPFESRQLV